jgi:hypothetical protein
MHLVADVGVSSLLMGVIAGALQRSSCGSDRLYFRDKARRHHVGRCRIWGHRCRVVLEGTTEMMSMSPLRRSPVVGHTCTIKTITGDAKEASTAARGDESDITLVSASGNIVEQVKDVGALRLSNTSWTTSSSMGTQSTIEISKADMAPWRS